MLCALRMLEKWEANVDASHGDHNVTRFNKDWTLLGRWRWAPIGSLPLVLAKCKKMRCDNARAKRFWIGVSYQQNNTQTRMIECLAVSHCVGDTMRALHCYPKTQSHTIAYTPKTLQTALFARKVICLWFMSWWAVHILNLRCFFCFIMTCIIIWQTQLYQEKNEDQQQCDTYCFYSSVSSHIHKNNKERNTCTCTWGICIGQHKCHNNNYNITILHFRSDDDLHWCLLFIIFTVIVIA